MTQLNWVRIAPGCKLPDPGQLVALSGDSGYISHRQFLTLGYYDNAFRPQDNGPIRWLNVQNDFLSDRGWYPSHWAEIPEGMLPPPVETMGSFTSQHECQKVKLHE